MTMTTAKRLLLGAGVALAATLGSTWPARRTIRPSTITVIIPFAGGSASDVVSRIMFDKMSKIDGPADHRREPARRRRQLRHRGARRKAAPDGYTLVGGGSGPVAANLALYKNLGYDPEKDLEMISPFAGFTIVVVASKNLPVKSLKELVDHAKANPGKLNYGSVGIGSSQHLAGEYFSAGHRHEAHPRALSQHRAVRPRPDRRPVPLGFQWYPERRRPDQRQGRDPARGRRRQALAALPDTPTTTEAGLPRIQGRRLVRAAGAGRHAEADPGAAQQGDERRR